MRLTVSQVLVVVDNVVEVGAAVVVGSLHPHQPGVLQVSVRVRVELVAVAVLVLDGFVCVPSSNFQR